MAGEIIGLETRPACFSRRLRRHRRCSPKQDLRNQRRSSCVHAVLSQQLVRRRTKWSNEIRGEWTFNKAYYWVEEDENLTRRSRFSWSGLGKGVQVR